MTFVVIFLSLFLNIRAEAKKINCFNMRNSNFTVAGKLGDKKYEIVDAAVRCSRGGWAFGRVDECIGEVRQRVVLITQSMEFQNAGYIDRDLWIATDSDEMTEVKTRNGFSKNVPVLRETAYCRKNGPKKEKPLFRQFSGQGERVDPATVEKIPTGCPETCVMSGISSKKGYEAQREWLEKSGMLEECKPCDR